MRDETGAWQNHAKYMPKKVKKNEIFINVLSEKVLKEIIEVNLFF